MALDNKLGFVKNEGYFYVQRSDNRSKTMYLCTYMKLFTFFVKGALSHSAVYNSTVNFCILTLMLFYEMNNEDERQCV